MTTANADYRVRTGAHKNEGRPEAVGADALVDFLQLLGRAARQFRTYPATSPLCIDAVDACQRAFTGIDPGAPVSIRVAPCELIADEVRIGRGTIVEQELARPLHRARVASLEIDRAASGRDWSQLCGALVACNARSKTKTSLSDRLLEAGVAAIVATMAPRPEIVDLGAPPAPVRDLVARERGRRAALPSGGPVQYFYPPDKGWIRLDPAVRYDSISLLDLAVLVQDPGELAIVLARLTDDGDDENGVTAGAALEQKYDDVATVIAMLDPHLARLLFGRLARAVLDLEPDRRNTLLRRSVLPRLLDGRADGESVLAEFPDVALADTLCLLLDLETAAPELLATAVDRLGLSPDRRLAVVPLIEERLRGGAAATEANTPGAPRLERYADALIRIDSAAGRDFAEFAAFDLSIDERTAAALADVRDAVGAADPIDARLACLSGLVQLEPNPTVVSDLVERAIGALLELRRADRWSALARWLGRLNDLEAGFGDSRPAAAEVVRAGMNRFCTRDLILQLGALCASGTKGTANAEAIVASLGPSLVPAWLDALDSPADRGRAVPLGRALSAYARQLAPAVARQLRRCGPEAARPALVLLGAAGAGYEAPIAEQLAHADERIGREALRALARIGTVKAAAAVVDMLEHGPKWAQAGAEDALWRLPPSLALAKARELLGRPAFVRRHPEVAARLVGRAALSGDEQLTTLLHRLAALRYCFWRPAVARVGATAREMLQ